MSFNVSAATQGLENSGFFGGLLGSTISGFTTKNVAPVKPFYETPTGITFIVIGVFIVGLVVLARKS